MNDPTQLTLEQQLSEVVTKFHRDQQGHSPTCSSTILSSMAIVLSCNVFTNTESELSQTEEGRKIIQSARREQRALTRRDIEGQVSRLFNRPVKRSFYDLDVRTGDQIEVYMLD